MIWSRRVKPVIREASTTDKSYAHSEEKHEPGHSRISAAQEKRRFDGERMIKDLSAICRKSLSRGEYLPRAELARRAGVSRSFIYQNNRAVEVIRDFYEQFPDEPLPLSARPMVEVRKWRARALNAERHMLKLREERRRLNLELSVNLGEARSRDQGLGGRDVLDVVAEVQELRGKVSKCERECDQLRRQLAASRRLISGMMSEEK